MALVFLIGHSPAIFDAILDAVEPRGEDGIQDAPADQEPYCVTCATPAGIFLAHGKEYRHYRGALTATSSA